MATAKHLLEQALHMRPADKFLIIDGLLQSLDEPDKTLDDIWATEAEKRLQAYKAGQIKAIPYDTVFGEDESAR